jgi:hypothetical protein
MCNKCRNSEHDPMTCSRTQNQYRVFHEEIFRGTLPEPNKDLLQ